MVSSDGQPEPPTSALLKLWARVPVVVRAIVVGFLVFAIAGSVALTAILVLVPAPWSILLMAGVLWAYLKYFSGSWWPTRLAILSISEPEQGGTPYVFSPTFSTNSPNLGSSRSRSYIGSTTR